MGQESKARDARRTEIRSWRKRLLSRWLQIPRGAVTAEGHPPTPGASQLLGRQRGCTWNGPGRSRPWWEHHMAEQIAKGPLAGAGTLSFRAGTRREPQCPQAPASEPEPRAVPHYLPGRAFHTSRQYSWSSTLLSPQHPVSAPPGGTQAEDTWQGPLGQEPGAPAPTPLQSGRLESKQTSASSNRKGGENQGGGKRLRTNNEHEHLPGAKHLTYIIPPNSYSIV